MGKSIMQRRFPLNKYKPLVYTLEVLVLVLVILFMGVYSYGYIRSLSEAEYYMQTNTTEFIKDTSVKRVSECVFEEGTSNCMITFEGEETAVPASEVTVVYAKLQPDTVYYSVDNNILIKSAKYAGFLEFTSASRVYFVMVFNALLAGLMRILRKGNRPVWSRLPARVITLTTFVLSILLLGVSFAVFGSGY